MPRPIEPEKREAILADIRGGQLGRNEIARKHGVAGSTVGKVASDEGLLDAFDRAETENATRAKRADLAKERAEVSALLLRRAKEALLQFDQPHVVFNIGGKDNVYTEHLMDRPPTGDMRNLAIVAGVAIQRHIELDRHDSDDGASDAASLVKALAAGLNAAADQMASGSASDRSGPPAAESEANRLDR